MTTTPSQRAREAAARLFASYSREQDTRSDNARDGLIDDSPTVQAFAQFEAETLERAAVIADDAGAAFAGLREGVMFARIAKDIRKLIPIPPGERP